MDAPDANVNNDTPGSNAGAGGNAVEANIMAKGPAAASGAMVAASNTVVMVPVRALVARRWNELIGALHSSGIMTLVTADKFITEQGLDLMQSLAQLLRSTSRRWLIIIISLSGQMYSGPTGWDKCMFTRCMHLHIMQSTRQAFSFGRLDAQEGGGVSPAHGPPGLD